jgi:hypothetical protein
MNSGTKRTLAELITLHELEPGLSEVITEGRVDAALLLWFLRRYNSDAAVYCVSDRLEVSAREVRNRGQSTGKKGSVIAAAMNVEEASTVAARKVTFVYDIDDDIIAGRSLPESACLMHTDYRTIEMYCFANNPLGKLLKVRLRASDDIKTSQVLDSIREPLVSIAFTRLVLSQVDPPVAVVEAIEKRCRINGEAMLIDIRTLIADSIDARGGARALGVDVDVLLSNQENVTSRWASDVRMVIRGHDFTRICCYYLKSTHPELFKEDRLPYRTPAVFEGTLIACLEADDLLQERLFQKLLARHT